MRTLLRPICFLLLLGAVVCLWAAMSTEEEKEVLSYKLSMPAANKILAALPAVTQYALSLPDLQARMARAMKQSFQERIKEMEGDSKMGAILKQNGLTAREYAVGVIALRMALMAASAPAGAAIPKQIVASPENIAFAKAHLNELKPKMDAADGISARR